MERYQGQFWPKNMACKLPKSLIMLFFFTVKKNLGRARQLKLASPSDEWLRTPHVRMYNARASTNGTRPGPVLAGGGAHGLFERLWFAGSFSDCASVG